MKLRMIAAVTIAIAVGALAFASPADAATTVAPKITASTLSNVNHPAGGYGSETVALTGAHFVKDKARTKVSLRYLAFGSEHVIAIPASDYTILSTTKIRFTTTVDWVNCPIDTFIVKVKPDTSKAHAAYAKKHHGTYKTEWHHTWSGTAKIHVTGD